LLKYALNERLAEAMGHKIIPLTAARPEIASEWHPTLNKDSWPANVGIGSHEVAWWRCRYDESHVFQQSVAHRVRRNCPFCNISTKSLLALFPDVAKQLHSTRNGDLNPKYVSPTTATLAWWQCAKNSEHVWEETVIARTGKKSPCPFCKGAKVSEDNSLARLQPELASEWHRVKNAELTPETVTTRYNKKVWWICKLKHEWQARVSVRIVEGSGCPFCANKYLLKENSLAVRFPEIAAQWHPTKNPKMLSSLQGSFVVKANRHLSPEDRPLKNRRLTPEDVSYGSHQKCWWQCPIDKKHVWEAAVKERTRGNGCPYCSNKRITENNNLAARYAAVAKQWHPTRNKPLLPSDITPGSEKLIWWRCHRSAKHVWQAVTPAIVRSWGEGNSGCPFCVGKKVTDESSFLAKHADAAKLWHPTLNDELTPEMVSPSSTKMIHWQCPQVADHVWTARANNIARTHQRGRSGCPFCAGRKVAHERSLEAKYPDLAKLWHRGLNKPLQPHQVTFGSNKVVWWRCPTERNHIWQRKINDMVDTWKRGLSTGCPECRKK
jgi:hypothetical protein